MAVWRGDGVLVLVLAIVSCVVLCVVCGVLWCCVVVVEVVCFGSLASVRLQWCSSSAIPPGYMTASGLTTGPKAEGRGMMEGAREGGEYVRERGKRKRACERKRAGEGGAQCTRACVRSAVDFVRFHNPRNVRATMRMLSERHWRRTGMSG